MTVLCSSLFHLFYKRKVVMTKKKQKITNISSSPLSPTIYMFHNEFHKFIDKNRLLVYYINPRYWLIHREITVHLRNKEYLQPGEQDCHIGSFRHDVVNGLNENCKIKWHKRGASDIFDYAYRVCIRVFAILKV